MRRLGLFIVLFGSLNAGAFDVPFRSRAEDAGLPGETLSTLAASARHAGMGNTGVASAGADAAYYNPAGIAGSRIGEMSIMSSPLFEGGQMNALALLYPWANWDHLGFMIYQLDSGEAEKTDSFGQSLGSFSEKNMMFSTTYARRLRGWLDAGFSVKWVRQSVADEDAGGYGADAGVTLNALQNRVRLGIAVQNLLAPTIKLGTEAESHATNVRAGLQTSVPVFGRMLVMTQDVNAVGGATRWGAGFQIDVVELRGSPLFLRWGINQREYTFGLGITQGALALDYAVSLNEIAMMHRFGFTFKYGLFQSFSASAIERKRKEMLQEERELDEIKSKLEIEKKSLGEEEKLVEMRARALRLFKDERYEEANKLAYEIMRISPEDPAAKELISQVRVVRERKRVVDVIASSKELYKQEKYAEVVIRIESNGASMADNHEAMALLNLARARVAIDAERYADAEAALVAVIESDPDNQEAGVLYKRLKEFQKLMSEEK